MEIVIMTQRDAADAPVRANYCLSPKTAARLAAYAKLTGENPQDILEDAATFHLDGLEEPQ